MSFGVIAFPPPEPNRGLGFFGLWWVDPLAAQLRLYQCIGGSGHLTFRACTDLSLPSQTNMSLLTTAAVWAIDLLHGHAIHFFEVDEAIFAFFDG